MKEYSFIFKSSTDNVTINFNEISVEDSINRFIGFLRSAGHNDDVIKCAAQDVLNGKWVKSFSNISTLQTQLNSVGHYNTLILSHHNHKTLLDGQVYTRQEGMYRLKSHKFQLR